jgi:hypothetical protein
MEIISYISPVIMRDMRDKLYSVGLIVLLIGIVSIIPYLIKAFFWVLLQMMYFPLTTMIILVNLLLWNYLYCVYTEKTEKK